MENFETTTVITHSTLMTEPINKEMTPNTIIEHLNLETFKLNACNISSQHNHKFCSFYHNPKDRKRPGSFYSAEMCSYIENNEVCPYGDDCTKSHSRVEQLYRTDKYKTKFCSYYPNNLDKCEYGPFCSFAHGENDIVIELIHNLEYDYDFYIFYFKTVWCPFNLTGHDKSKCVYAHNWQDFRRKPHLYNYDPQPCSNWKSMDFILNYADGCPQKENCKMCHGWKELEYHPLSYKTKICVNPTNCIKAKDCPFYHVLGERHITYNIFQFRPKNRIVSNTFKRISPRHSNASNIKRESPNIHKTLGLFQVPSNSNISLNSIPESFENIPMNTLKSGNKIKMGLLNENAPEFHFSPQVLKLQKRPPKNIIDSCGPNMRFMESKSKSDALDQYLKIISSSKSSLKSSPKDTINNANNVNVNKSKNLIQKLDNSGDFESEGLLQFFILLDIIKNQIKLIFDDND